MNSRGGAENAEFFPREIFKDNLLTNHTFMNKDRYTSIFILCVLRVSARYIPILSF